jgi:signal transduction histidine kinase
VFDRFYRAETACGLPGLGLAVVHSVAQTDGGDVFTVPRRRRDRRQATHLLVDNPKI